MRTHKLFVAKQDFSKIMCIHRAKGRGLMQCGCFTHKGGGEINYYDFVRASFIDGPLLSFYRNLIDFIAAFNN